MLYLSSDNRGEIISNYSTSDGGDFAMTFHEPAGIREDL